MNLKRKGILDGIAVENLGLYLVIGQVVMLTLLWFGGVDPNVIAYAPALVFKGEIWRLVTFVFEPPMTSPDMSLGLIFMVFGWYVFWLMSNALEVQLGVARFTRFLLIGWLATIGLSFFYPNAYYTNGPLLVSVFLAFAYLNPDFELLLMFIFPVKIKWLALITWIGYGFLAVTSGFPAFLMVLAATLNFFIFFGRELASRAKSGRKRMSQQAERLKTADEAFHTCTVCGVTDRMDPDLQFYYKDGEGVCENCTPTLHETK